MTDVIENSEFSNTSNPNNSDFCKIYRYALYNNKMSDLIKKFEASLPRNPNFKLYSYRIIAMYTGYHPQWTRGSNYNDPLIMLCMKCYHNLVFGDSIYNHHNFAKVPQYEEQIFELQESLTAEQILEIMYEEYNTTFCHECDCCLLRIY